MHVCHDHTEAFLWFSMLFSSWTPKLQTQQRLTTKYRAEPWDQWLLDSCWGNCSHLLWDQNHCANRVACGKLPSHFPVVTMLPLGSLPSKPPTARVRAGLISKIFHNSLCLWIIKLRQMIPEAGEFQEHNLINSVMPYISRIQSNSIGRAICFLVSHMSIYHSIL